MTAMTPITMTPARRRALTSVRIAFGLAWAVDAVLKWLPGFTNGTLISTLKDAAGGQPAWLRAWIGFWVGLFGTNEQAWGYALAVAESLIALCLLAGAFTNAVCVLGGVLSLGIWSAGEGFGGPYVSGSTDIDASIIYVFVFALLAFTAAGGAHGLDVWLRPRLGRLAALCSVPTRPVTPRGASGRDS